MVQGSGFRVHGSGFRVQGTDFRVQISSLVSGFGVCSGLGAFFGSFLKPGWILVWCVSSREMEPSRDLISENVLF